MQYSRHGLRPSLTTKQLKQIKQCSSADDVPALLWEIALLRYMCRRTHQLLQSRGNATIEELLRTELYALDFIKDVIRDSEEFNKRLLPDVSAPSHQNTYESGKAKRNKIKHVCLK